MDFMTILAGKYTAKRQVNLDSEIDFMLINILFNVLRIHLFYKNFLKKIMFSNWFIFSQQTLRKH